MKKYLLLLPSLIFPYFMIFLLTSLLTQFMADIIFPNNNGLLAILYLFILFIVALICNIIFAVLSVKQKWKARSVAKANMLIKLIQIPAYITIFIFGLLFLITIFTIGFSVFFVVFDLLAIFLTGLIGCITVYRCWKDSKISKLSAIINGFLQFMFCVDIISAIIIFVKSKSNPS